MAAQIDYARTSGTLYDDVTDPAKVGKFRAWYHRSRFERLRATVRELAKPGGMVLDVACGNCVWNTERLAVCGVDINQAMLSHARMAGRLQACSVVDMSGGTVSVASNSVDVLVCSEVLEHLPNYEKILSEFHRIVKPGGHLVATVPYDQFGTPFFVLFNGWCLLKGHVLGDDYYKGFCGHINHFSKYTIGRAIQTAGFSMVNQFAHNGFVIYNIAQKQTANIVR